jgi:hypothetical protein
MEGKFTGDSRKLGIISSDYWEISPPGDFLPSTLGNLLCFRDSVYCSLESLKYVQYVLHIINIRRAVGGCFTEEQVRMMVCGCKTIVP